MSITKVGLIQDPHFSGSVPRSRTESYNLDILRKILFVCKKVDVLIIAGDIFHTPTVSCYLLNVIATAFRRIQEKIGTQIYTIPGNHDIPYSNYDANYNRTALALMESVRVVKSLTKERFGNTTFIGMPTVSKVKDLDVPIDTTNDKVLIGHYFYDYPHDRSFSLTKEYIKKLNYKIVYLGHEHSEQATEQINNTNLYRIGAISRGSSHEFNLKRVPKFLLLECDNGVKSQEIISIEHRPYSEVFIKEPTKKDLGLEVFISNITDFLTTLEESKVKRESMREVLTKMKAPEPVITYIKHIYNTQLLEF